MSCCNTPRTTDEIPPTRQKVFVFYLTYLEAF